MADHHASKNNMVRERLDECPEWLHEQSSLVLRVSASFGSLFESKFDYLRARKQQTFAAFCAQRACPSQAQAQAHRLENQVVGSGVLARTSLLRAAFGSARRCSKPGVMY